jgi:hypothetical protein
MAERADATIVEVPASHVSFVSQPDAATQLILQAVEATTPAASRTETSTHTMTSRLPLGTKSSIEWWRRFARREPLLVDPK